MNLTDSLQRLSLATRISSISSEESTPTTPSTANTSILTKDATHSSHVHQAQFYDDEDHLFRAISDFFLPFFDDLGEGELCAVIIARPRPIHYFKDLLRLRGYTSGYPDDKVAEILDYPDSSANTGRHVLFVDAYRTLDKMMPGPEINYQDLEKILHELFSQLPGRRRSDGQRQGYTYVYGELVDILCERRQHLAALELEKIWNDFLATRKLSLLCGYSMDGFRDQLVANVFQQICHTHTIVSPTESYSTLSTVEQRMAMVATLQQNVKALQATIDHQHDFYKLEERQKRYQEQFVDILCHELRNPVSGIAGNVELLQTGLEIRHTILHTAVDSRDSATLANDDVAALRNQWADDTESVEAIAICAAHMKTVTDDLLSLSMLEGGKIMLENVPFDPKATISSVIKMFSTPAKKKGVQLLADVPEGDFRILGDAGRLAQIIVNLVSNGLKFTESGSVTVGFRRLERRDDSSTFQVIVRDTGKGMCEDDKLWLFRRFTQPVSTSFAKYGGSGLGLYISKCLVELMGGALHVESEWGNGSTFIFTFQAKDYLAEGSRLLSDKKHNHHYDYNDNSRNEEKLLPAIFAAIDKPVTFDSNSCSVKHVLLADDNSINLRVVSRFLEAAAISVTTASNGYEAISTLIKLSTSETPVDLVLMDLDMPFMDGISATRSIRGLDNDSRTRQPSSSSQISKVPIIGMTGHIRREKFADACQAGMDDCVGKPIAKTVLLDLINSVQNRNCISQ
jgi:signal transduction histidine kinase/CheY-like chemotaxis protein